MTNPRPVGPHLNPSDADLQASDGDSAAVEKGEPQAVYGTDRSAARLAAVQALYQMDLAHTDLNVVLGEFTDHRFGSLVEETPISEADPDVFALLVRGVMANQREIDPMVDGQLATGWRLARIDSILRAMLRAGAFELLKRDDVPAKVVINEYIDMAHQFFDGDEAKVVNGVLDKLAHRLRPNELTSAGHG
ncbi:MAG: transcription antitermination factor NusB [Pseudomonadota bacterium]